MVQETKQKTKKVLVIDDDVLLARLIEHNLSQIEVEVLKAYTGYDGISMVRSQQPDRYRWLGGTATHPSGIQGAHNHAHHQGK